MSDTGIGISLTSNKSCSKPSTGRYPTSRKYGGTGLITISHELSRLLGGEIRLTRVLVSSTHTLFAAQLYAAAFSAVVPSTESPEPVRAIAWPRARQIGAERPQ